MRNPRYVDFEDLIGFLPSPDDPDTITEAHIPGGEDGPDIRTIPCGWGYTGCMGFDLAEDMIYDSYNEGWCCQPCNAAAMAEYEDYCDVRRYG